jgi:hypothetical protein
MAKSANVELLEAKLVMIKALRQQVKELRVVVAQERTNAKEAREAKRNARRETAIQKAQERLAKLTGPVGIKAKRASKRPSKVESIPLAA